MDDQLKQQLLQLLTDLTNTAKDAATWVGQQLPPLVWEKIWFGRVWLPVMCILSATLAIYLTRKGREMWADADVGSEERAAASVVLQVLGGLAVVPTLIFAHDAVQAWVAPRLYIVNWLISLARDVQGGK